MALESGTFINSLNSSNPVATDGLAFADDHMRLIKATILASFPNITGAMTATHTILNGLDGRVTAIESGVHASGTKMLFAQTAAPTGWTKDTTNNNDSAIRVVTGTAGTGGTNALSTLDATAVGTINNSVSGSTAPVTLTTSQIPSHYHHMFVNTNASPSTGSNVGSGNVVARSAAGGGAVDEKYAMRAASGTPAVGRSASVGSSGSHSHGAGSLSVQSTFTGQANALDVKYVDVIIATKD